MPEEKTTGQEHLETSEELVAEVRESRKDLPQTPESDDAGDGGAPGEQHSHAPSD